MSWLTDKFDKGFFLRKTWSWSGTGYTNPKYADKTKKESWLMVCKGNIGRWFTKQNSVLEDKKRKKEN